MKQAYIFHLIRLVFHPVGIHYCPLMNCHPYGIGEFHLCYFAKRHFLYVERENNWEDVHAN